MDSGAEGDAEPRAQRSLRAVGRGDGNLRSSDARADAGGLDWDAFRKQHHPGSHRHNLQAIVAYAEYQRSGRVRARSESVRLDDAVSSEVIEPAGTVEDTDLSEELRHRFRATRESRREHDLEPLVSVPSVRDDIDALDRETRRLRIVRDSSDS